MFYAYSISPTSSTIMFGRGLDTDQADNRKSIVVTQLHINVRRRITQETSR